MRDALSDELRPSTALQRALFDLIFRKDDLPGRMRGGPPDLVPPPPPGMERKKLEDFFEALRSLFRSTGQTEKVLVLLEETLMELENASFPFGNEKKYVKDSVKDLLEETQEKLEERSAFAIAKKERPKSGE